MKSTIFLKIIFLTGTSSSLLAMEEPPLVHIQRAGDATPFTRQVVAYTPVPFISDHFTYKEKVSGAQNPALRYGYVTPGLVPDWRFYGKEVEREWGYGLALLVNFDVVYNYHVLLNRLLKNEKLLMRKITSGEAIRLLQIIEAQKAHFEVDCGEKKGALKQLVSKH